jgi:hypothetical protein
MSKKLSSVLEERESRYGSFDDNAEIAQKVKAIFRTAPKWDRLSCTQQEALDMTASKISRMLSGDPSYEDNVVDIIGYMTRVLESMRRIGGKGE